MSQQNGPKQIWKNLNRGVNTAFQHVSLTFALPAIISALLLCIFLLRRYIKWNVPCKSKNRLEGKTAIITGANSGLGKATALELARRGTKVILACKNLKKGEAVARLIVKKTGNTDVYASLLDLASLRSIREFVKYFDSTEKKLNILINNAGDTAVAALGVGVACTSGTPGLKPGFQWVRAYLGPKASTEDGYERNLGVNYLGHFYLTYLLRDKLRKCAPSRIINVCSNGYLKGKFDFDDLPLATYDMYDAYCRSKLAQVLFNVECHRNWYPDMVLSYAVHPGCVYTDLMRNWPGISGKILRTFAEFMFKTPEEGCQTIIHCVVADGLKEYSGRLFENCKVVTRKGYTKHLDICKKLWDLSLQLCGEEPEIDHVVPSTGENENQVNEKAEQSELPDQEEGKISSEIKFRKSDRRAD